MGANFVIAIDASLNFNMNAEVDNVIDLVIRSSQITVRHLDEHLKKHADFVITPDIGDIHWSEFNRVDELIQKGEEAAKKVMPKIKNLLKRKRNIFSRLMNQPA
jgi:NTE family protein